MVNRALLARILGVELPKLNIHLDASESVIATKALEEVRSATYDIKYPELMGREFAPVDSSLNPGTEVVTYHQYDSYGVAKIISNYADDLPRADVSVKEFSSRVRSLGASYGYSIQDLRAASMAKVNLPQRKADAGRRSIEEGIDRIVRNGDTTNGLLGLLNQPNAIVYTIPLGVSGFADWPRKTPDEVIADMNGPQNFMYDTTNGVEIADTMILPLDAYAHIASRRMGDGSDTTILEFFLENSAFVKTVAPWYPLKNAGVSGAKRMLTYRRNPNAVQLVIPQDFEQFPPQAKNLELVTPCHARCGGVVLYYPLSMAYADGIMP